MVVDARVDVVGAVPALVPELVSTLCLPDLDAITDGDQRVGTVATDGALARRETRHLVAYDVGTERYDGRQCWMSREEQV